MHMWVYLVANNPNHGITIIRRLDLDALLLYFHHTWNHSWVLMFLGCSKAFVNCIFVLKNVVYQDVSDTMFYLLSSFL
jgi:hypothetical protein